jgi:hypothetical protein
MPTTPDHARGDDIEPTWQAAWEASTTLSVPASFDSLGLVRVVVGGVAAQAEMTIDGTEDLCLAVDEACLVLLEAFVPGTPDRDGRLHLEFTHDVDGGCIAVAVRRPGAMPSGPSSDVTTLVLDALTSGWSLEQADRGPSVHLTVHTGSK